MGGRYKEVVGSGGGRLWSDYRNGLAHEYAIKGESVVWMLKGKEDCGIGKAQDGTYWFVVERYFEDFMTAAERLYQELLKDPKLPR